MYLGTSPNSPPVAQAIRSRRMGLMCQPGSNKPRPGMVWAADNGCFASTWDHDRWVAWLARDHPRTGCLFAVVPDVVGDAAATRARWDIYRHEVAALRYPLAYVAQDGSEDCPPPWDTLDTLFIGGSTEWKMSEHAYAVAAEAHRRGKWVHIGRVNSWSRFDAWRSHADSADGTFLAFGPLTNIAKVVEWGDRHNLTPTLFEEAS